MSTTADLYKTSLSVPGILQVRRFARDGQFTADAIHDLLSGIDPEPTIIDPLDPTRRKGIPVSAQAQDLLVPIFRGGKCVYETPSLADSRERTRAQLGGFHAGVKRFAHPHQYPVGLERGLHELRTRLILQARGLEH